MNAKNIKVNKTDLIGQIEFFPIEVVEQMVKEQVAQGNKANIGVFANDDVCAPYGGGGFTWSATEAGHSFWSRVLREKDFALFFSKYPKKVETDTTSKLVYAVGNVNNGKNVIKALESRGGINAWNFDGETLDSIYYIEPGTNHIRYLCVRSEKDKRIYDIIVAAFTQIEVEPKSTTVEVSMEDIARMMGVDVSDLRIKE